MRVTMAGRDNNANANGRLILDRDAMERAIRRIGHEIVERTPDLASLVLLAIPEGGVALARRIQGFIQEAREIHLHSVPMRDAVSRRQPRHRPGEDLPVVGHVGARHLGGEELGVRLANHRLRRVAHQAATGVEPCRKLDDAGVAGQ